MVDAEPAFRPVRPRDGFPALEDLGLIGDGETAALVALDGRVVWLCVPGFDSDPLFCGLLDRTGGGRFEVAPDGVVEARQRYQAGTGVLITERWSAHIPPPRVDQTPWQELFRAYTGQMDTGSCLDFAVEYQDIAHTKGLPRDSH